jgi:hypothetical protein
MWGLGETRFFPELEVATEAVGSLFAADAFWAHQLLRVMLSVILTKSFELEG